MAEEIREPLNGPPKLAHSLLRDTFSYSRILAYRYLVRVFIYSRYRPSNGVGLARLLDGAARAGRRACPRIRHGSSETSSSACSTHSGRPAAPSHARLSFSNHCGIFLRHGFILPQGRTSAPSGLLAWFFRVQPGSYIHPCPRRRRYGPKRALPHRAWRLQALRPCGSWCFTSSGRSVGQ